MGGQKVVHKGRIYHIRFLVRAGYRDHMGV